jgi:hypothetical protein
MRSSLIKRFFDFHRLGRNAAAPRGRPCSSPSRKGDSIEKEVNQYFVEEADPASRKNENKDVLA